LGPYIIQAIFLLVAPALYAATIYMQLGRIITMTDGESHALISRKWMTKIFVTGDVLSFFLQGGGEWLSSIPQFRRLADNRHLRWWLPSLWNAGGIAEWY
jgi:hypothetical protein